MECCFVVYFKVYVYVFKSQLQYLDKKVGFTKLPYRQIIIRIKGEVKLTLKWK